jgi:hypothetical protein
MLALKIDYIFLLSKDNYLLMLVLTNLIDKPTSFKLN